MSAGRPQSAVWLKQGVPSEPCRERRGGVKLASTMQSTLAPDIERQALEEIRRRGRDESNPPILIVCMKLVARLFVHGSPERFGQSLVDAVTRHLEARNDRLARHLRWFGPATAALRAKLASPGLRAGDELGIALDAHIRQIDRSVARLLPVMEALDAGSKTGLAVQRSIRLLLQVKARAMEMKRIGGLVDPPDETTRRIEQATSGMVERHGQAVADSVPGPDPRLLKLAQQSLAREQFTSSAGHRHCAERS